MNIAYNNEFGAECLIPAEIFFSEEATEPLHGFIQNELDKDILSSLRRLLKLNYKIPKRTAEHTFKRLLNKKPHVN